MKRVFPMIVLALFTFALTLDAQAQNDTAAKRLSADDIQKMLADKQKFFFLDVREPAELEEYGTLKSAVNIPLSQLESRLKEIPKDVPVVTACQRGARAGRAAALLEKNGYKVIGLCGMVDWKQQGVELIFPKAEKK